MLAKISKIGITAAISAAGGYYFRDDLKVFAATLSDSASSVASVRSRPYYDEDFPRKPWDYNWDQ